MKKTLSVIAILLAVMMLMMSFAACGDKKSEDKDESSSGSDASSAADDTEEPTEPTAVSETAASGYDGVYTLIEYTIDGEDMLESAEEYGLNFEMVVSGDTATIFDEDWAIQGDKLIGEGEEIPFTVSGDQFIVEDESNRMVFEKDYE